LMRAGDGSGSPAGVARWFVEVEPGSGPILGMDLGPVPVGGAAPGPVEIDPVTLQNIGVRTATAGVEPLERAVRTTGVFEADERARTAVSLKVGGWVEQIGRAHV